MIRRTEFVRGRLSRTICARYADGERRLPVVTLGPTWEDELRDAIEYDDRGLTIHLPAANVEALRQAIQQCVDELPKTRWKILLVSPEVRPAVRRIVAARSPELVVLSFNEITPEANVETVGVVPDCTVGAETWKS